ncbi:alpha/beta hydrolase [Bacillus songklensis]|uniref:Alpha/beta hydrolase n=1 Tax=Bacillus songklensis TaxID=1069116 RepID=A0ABV8B8S3_9BACI
MKQVIENIRNNKNLVFTCQSSEMNEDIKRYVHYYKLPTEDVSYCCGYEPIGHERLFVQSFRPRQLKGHLLLLHGYYDHAGVLSKAIRFLVQQHFHVLTFDLPGHGLSTGERAAIADFSLYVESVREVIRRHLSSAALPVYIVAHSTGAAAAIDYILNDKEASAIQKAVFVAPLVRSYHWNATSISIKALRLFVRQLKRVIRNNSSDAAFLRFMREDPLQHDKVPLSWVEALMKWNDSIEKGEPSAANVLVIQGKKDTTVDWEYNIVFLLRKFPNITVQLVENGKHHLLNEEEMTRRQVFNSINRYLTSGG